MRRQPGLQSSEGLTELAGQLLSRLTPTGGKLELKPGRRSQFLFKPGSPHGPLHRLLEHSHNMAADSKAVSSLRPSLRNHTSSLCHILFITSESISRGRRIKVYLLKEDESKNLRADFENTKTNNNNHFLST